MADQLHRNSTSLTDVTTAQDRDDWHRISVTAHQIPRISPEWLETQRKLIGDAAFKSEYLNIFTDTESQYFPSAAIHRAIEPGLMALPIRLLHGIEEGTAAEPVRPEDDVAVAGRSGWVIGCDLGQARDYSAITV